MEQKKYEVTANQLVTDLKVLADGIFEADMAEEEGGLILSFTNGQKFRISVERL